MAVRKKAKEETERMLEALAVKGQLEVRSSTAGCTTPSGSTMLSMRGFRRVENRRGGAWQHVHSIYR
jgi:hypothetical protein